MVNQIFLIFDYDDTIMPSNISRNFVNHPDYGAQSVKAQLQVFYEFICYWKRVTGIPIIILSAGTIVYLHLVSLYGTKLNISVNYFDPRMDLCMFIPIPLAMTMRKKTDYLTLEHNNDVSRLLQNNLHLYYYNVWTKHPNNKYYQIHLTQIKDAESLTQLPNQNNREYINGISHRKIVYLPTGSDLSGDTCFYLPGVNYAGEVGFYEFLNCRRQFKNLDGLRKHLSFVLNKPARDIDFYFFDDKASHLGMGERDIYLSKPDNYPSLYFVNKVLPILGSLITPESISGTNANGSREWQRRNEIKLLNRLVAKLSSDNKLVFVSKQPGASPLSRRRKTTKPLK